MNKPEFKSAPERRYIDPVEARIELREAPDNGEMIIEGMPILYGVRTILWPGFAEVIEKNACTNALERRNAYLLWQHKSGEPMASYKNDTLQHEEREDGVFIKADCSKTVWGRDGYEAIKNKLIDKMSFSFVVKEQRWEDIENPDGSILTVRHITEIEELYDFAPVTFPAYSDTEVYSRSFEAYKQQAPQKHESESYAAEARARRLRLSEIINN